MSNPTTAIRRSVVEIVAEMLFVCSNSGANKTAIMYRCNLSYAQLQRYLSGLCARKLLAEKEGRFVVTDKGREFLEQLSNVIAIIRYLKEDESGTDGLTTSLPIENGSFLKVRNNNGAKT